MRRERKNFQWLNLTCLTWQAYSELGARKKEKGAWELAKAKATELRQQRLFYQAPAPRYDRPQRSPENKNQELEDVLVEPEPPTPTRRPASASGKKKPQAAPATGVPVASGSTAAAAAAPVPAPAAPVPAAPAVEEPSAPGGGPRQIIINIGR